MRNVGLRVFFQLAISDPIARLRLTKRPFPAMAATYRSYKNGLRYATAIGNSAHSSSWVRETSSRCGGLLNSGTGGSGQCAGGIERQNRTERNEKEGEERCGG